jgi:hypothetical protein
MTVKSLWSQQTQKKSARCNTGSSVGKTNSMTHYGTKFWWLLKTPQTLWRLQYHLYLGPVRATLGKTDMCVNARYVWILNNILGVYLTTLLLFKTLVHTRSFQRSEWLCQSARGHIFKLRKLYPVKNNKILSGQSHYFLWFLNVRPFARKVGCPWFTPLGWSIYIHIFG